MTFLMHPIGFRYRTGSHMVQFSPPHEFLGFYCVLSHYFTIVFDLNVQTGFAATTKISLRMLQSEVLPFALSKGCLIPFSQAAGSGFRRSMASIN